MQDTTPPAAKPSLAAPAPAIGARPSGGPGVGVVVLFTLTTFLSALLLFAVQPMFAKMVLPVLGGAPSVWAVAMLFFQAALLAGYCYAHALIRFLPAWQTGFIHLALCIAALLFLPIGLPQNFGEPPPGEPYLWQLGLFATAVGLPFFAVAANAPLLQAWFAATGHPDGRDPYFLYGASNLGSLLVLLAYPLVLEPTFGLRQLSAFWTIGFALLTAALVTTFVAVWAARGRPSSTAHSASSTQAGIPDAAPTWGRRLGWIGLALVPSALLTAFTNHVTMDVASAPLLWVLPLALYLLTFVLVFRERPILLLPLAIIIGLAVAAFAKFYNDRILGGDMHWQTTLAFGATAAAAYVVLQRLVLPYSTTQWLRGVHLAAVIAALFAMSQTRFESWFISSATGVAVFFTATMVAHRTLYEARPAARYLTEFYLWMSFGGVLGGLFAALIAPQIFSEVFEYPLLVALTMACRPGALNVRFKWAERDNLMGLWLVIAGAALALIWLPYLIVRLPRVDTDGFLGAAWWLWGPAVLYMKARLAVFEWGTTAALAAAFALGILAFRRLPSRQLVLAMGMCAAVILLPSGVRRSDAQRSYFGIYRVYMQGDYNILMHGTTLHGAQKVRDEKGEYVVDTSPATYYHPTSPMARAVEIVREHVGAQGGTKRFGVVGLGSGSLACHAAEGEEWRFFEIDPLIVKIASDSDNFTYLANCQPTPPDIVIGDARLTIAKEAAGSFDLLLIDAFSSDAVPIHLMTAEALTLYLDKISANGIVVLHISNRYLDLDAVLGATAKLVPQAYGLIVSDDTSDGGYGSTSSTIAVFARRPEALAPFRELGDVRELDDRGVKAWTDDFSDIIGPFFSKLRINE